MSITKAKSITYQKQYLKCWWALSIYVDFLLWEVNREDNYWILNDLVLTDSLLLTCVK